MKCDDPKCRGGCGCTQTGICACPPRPGPEGEAPTHWGPRFDAEHRCLRHREPACPSCLAYALGDANAEIARLKGSGEAPTMEEIGRAIDAFEAAVTNRETVDTPQRQVDDAHADLDAAIRRLVAQSRPEGEEGLRGAAEAVLDLFDPDAVGGAGCPHCNDEDYDPSHRTCCRRASDDRARLRNEAREAADALRAALSSPSAESGEALAPWYEADGSTVMLPAAEVERRRRAAASVLAAARLVMHDLDTRGGLVQSGNEDALRRALYDLDVPNRTSPEAHHD